jgi:hypothetical protein
MIPWLTLLKKIWATDEKIKSKWNKLVKAKFRKMKMWLDGGSSTNNKFKVIPPRQFKGLWHYVESTSTKMKTAKRIKASQTRNDIRATIENQEIPISRIGHQKIQGITCIILAKRKGTHSPIVFSSNKKKDSINLNKEVMWCWLPKIISQT